MHVIYYADCKNLVMRYTDPLTGKQHRKTKYTDPQTGETTETGTSRKFARKLAAQWEADLNAGRDARTIAFPVGVGCVYFLDSGLGVIKIGFTLNGLEQRIRVAETYYPNAQLLCAIPGDRKTEQAIHRRLRRSGIVRELFYATREVLALIETVRKMPAARIGDNALFADWSDEKHRRKSDS